MCIVLRCVVLYTWHRSNLGDDEFSWQRNIWSDHGNNLFWTEVCMELHWYVCSDPRLKECFISAIWVKADSFCCFQSCGAMRKVVVFVLFCFKLLQFCCRVQGTSQYFCKKENQEGKSANKSFIWCLTGLNTNATMQGVLP